MKNSALCVSLFVFLYQLRHLVCFSQGFEFARINPWNELSRSSFQNAQCTQLNVSSALRMPSVRTELQVEAKKSAYYKDYTDSFITGENAKDAMQACRPKRTITHRQHDIPTNKVLSFQA